jgi:hypothetical protein
MVLRRSMLCSSGQQPRRFSIGSSTPVIVNWRSNLVYRESIRSI